MPHVAARTASRDRDTGRYQSHRPEQTLLYQIVDEYYPAFAALMAEQGKELPGYVQREFEEFLQCGGWSMAFYGFAASLATPSTWSLSAVSVAVSARAVGRGGWPKVPPCWLMKYCLNNPCVSGC
ncbi:transposase [Klebsiella pneumoniae]|uniref:Transposase n=1 Tax=Klebsiella pneumoniae TaxID=573 RepID=A0A378CPH8_KLEPN|nr:transposase [Klebsiella pneumoniae]